MSLGGDGDHWMLPFRLLFSRGCSHNSTVTATIVVDCSIEPTSCAAECGIKLSHLILERLMVFESLRSNIVLVDARLYLRFDGELVTFV